MFRLISRILFKDQICPFIDTHGLSRVNNDGVAGILDDRRPIEPIPRDQFSAAIDRNVAGW